MQDQDTQKFYVEIQVDQRMPDEYKQRELQFAREKAGRQIFDLLWKNKLPVVVDIQEIILQSEKDFYYHAGPRSYDTCEKIRIEISITPVEHRHVVLQSQKYAQHRLHSDEKPRTTKPAFSVRETFSRFVGWFSAFRR